MESQSDEQMMDGATVKRRFYTQSNFDLANDRRKQTSTVRQEVCNKLKEYFTPTRACCKKSLLSFFPFIDILRTYSIGTDLLGDIVSGLTIGVMHIPQGMAYGMLANLDPVYGLYTSFFPVILYFFLGTSRHISMGTFAVVSLMIGVVVDKADCSPSNSISLNTTADANGTMDCVHSNCRSHGLLQNSTVSNATDFHSSSGNYDVEMCKVGYAVAASMMVGIYQLLMGIFKFGFVTIYLLDPLTRALTAGAAVHVFTSQIRHVFGINTESFQGPLKLVYIYIEFFKRITSINFASLVTAVICIAIIYCVQRWLNPLIKKKVKIPLPIELLVLIFGTLISWLARFSSKDVFNMKIVGDIPTGFPTPAFPRVNHMQSVAVDAVGIALVSFTISISMAKMFAQKHGYSLDSNQELKAYGITNFVCSILNCYVGTASLSRSVLQEAAGGRTQVAGLVSCCLLLVVLLALGPLFMDLPKCVLAAIIIVNLRNVLLQITDLPKLFRISFIDMLIWLVTFLAVVLTDVDLGLFIGVVFSLLTVVIRTQRVHTSILGQISDTDVYEDVKKYPSAKEMSDIKIFRFSASLCYTNADNFIEKLYTKTHCNPVEIKASIRNDTLKCPESLKDAEVVQPINNNIDRATEESNGHNTKYSSSTLPIVRVILDCACMVFIDAVGISKLKQMIKDYSDIGVQVSFAGCREGVYELLKRTVCTTNDKKGNVKVLSKIYLDVHDAVVAATGDDDPYASDRQFFDGNGNNVTGVKQNVDSISIGLVNGDAVSSDKFQMTSET